MFIRSLAGASHILACRYSATLALAHYNKSMLLVPYQLGFVSFALLYLAGCWRLGAYTTH
jgi:hypothetical protein